MIVLGHNNDFLPIVLVLIFDWEQPAVENVVYCIQSHATSLTLDTRRKYIVNSRYNEVISSLMSMRTMLQKGNRENPFNSLYRRGSLYRELKVVGCIESHTTSLTLNTRT